MESIVSIHRVLESHEFSAAMKLGMKMAKAGKKGYFETWVHKEQHVVQELGRAYGDRLISSAAMDAIDKADEEIKVSAEPDDDMRRRRTCPTLSVLSETGFDK